MKLAENVIRELKSIGANKYPLYEKILKHSFDINSPIFAKDKFSRAYRELANDGEWFANQMVANACLEGYGAQQIWKFSNKLDNEEYAKKVRQHALDESRHSTMFISMLHLTFPGLDIDSETSSKIDKMQPRFTKQNHPEIKKVNHSDRLFEI